MRDIGSIHYNIYKLTDVTTYVDYRGKTPTKSKSGVFLVTAKNVQKGYIDYSLSQEYIPESTYLDVMSRGKPQIGDVIITTEAPLGNVAQVDRDDIAIAQRIIKYRGKPEILRNDYLMYYLLSPEFQKELNASSTGSTVKGIKGSRLHKMKIAIPSIDSQIYISTVLRKWDKAIDTIDKLIEAKKKLKQALMQKLLTGQIRFPGVGKPVTNVGDVPEGWKLLKLGDICRIVIGKTPSRNKIEYWDSEKKTKNIWITISDMTSEQVSDSKEYISDLALKACNMKTIPLGTLIVSFKLSIGKMAFVSKDCYSNEAIASLYPKTQDIDMKFLSMIIPQAMMNSESSIAIKGKTLNQEKLKSIKLNIPQIEEQVFVGKILGSLDSQIKNLYQVKQLTDQQKLGLMNLFFK